MLGAQLNSSKATLAERYNLDPFHIMVLDRIMEGDSNMEIALYCHKTESWTKAQVSDILERTGAPSRARLMALLWHQGWGFKVPAVVEQLPKGRD